MKKALVLGAMLIALATQVFAGWETAVNVDPFDDGKQTIIAQMVTGSHNRNVTLAVVQLPTGELGVLVNWTAYLANEGTIYTRYRVRQESPVNGRWNSTGSGDYTIFNGDAKALIRSMVRGGTFTIQAQDFQGTAYTATFDLTGLAEAVNSTGLNTSLN